MYNAYKEMLIGKEQKKLMESKRLKRPKFTSTASMNILQRIFAINEQDQQRLHEDH